MIPPILEIFVVWHPDDPVGRQIADQFVEHFHGTAFSGLIGGAVEIYIRSEGWLNAEDAPRPLPVDTLAISDGAGRTLTAIVPVLGNGFAAAVQEGAGPWYDYAQKLVVLKERSPANVGIFPLRLSEGATDGTTLGGIFGPFQQIGIPSARVAEELPGLRSRDLAQGIAQLADQHSQLQVFVSHTKRASANEGEHLDRLVERVRCVIANTRLREYFDANALQPGSDWANDLDANARSSALLAVRSDLYASREWCQREIAMAKHAGMPVVILDALNRGEERGSFLMDHVARIPNHSGIDELRDEAILKALNQLVDECLKRELWARQHRLTDGGAEWGIAWWAPHAPEPLTLTRWLATNMGTLGGDDDVRVLHPDPPLGPVEREALRELADISGLSGRLDIMTPRGLAARGG